MLDLAAILDGARKAGVSDVLFSIGLPPAYKLGDEYMFVGQRIVGLPEMYEVLEAVNPSWPSLVKEVLARKKPPSDEVASLGGVHTRIRAHLAWVAPDPFAQVLEGDGRGDLLPVLNLRLFPIVPRPLEELGLPLVLKGVVERRFGLFLIVGPTDSGKTTTLAALTELINAHHPRHVVTIEEPIEYVYERKQAIIHQREVGRHVQGLLEALRSALRQNVSVVVLGEVRSPEEIMAMLETAETGHLVLATMHARGVVHALERIYWAFPPEQRQLALASLASHLVGVIAQRLIPTGEGERRRRVLAYELLLLGDRARQLLLEGRLASLYEVMMEGGGGNRTLEASLASLVRAGLITLERARVYANREESLVALLRDG